MAYESKFCKMTDFGQENSFDAMLHHLNLLSNTPLNDAHCAQAKSMLQSHRMKNSLFAVLCDIKERTALSIRNNMFEEEKENPDLFKLNNLLTAQDIMGPSKSSSEEIMDVGGDPVVYQQKFDYLKQTYNKEMGDYEKQSNIFTTHVHDLLLAQKQFRPISDLDIKLVLASVKRKISNIEIELKNLVCHIVMDLKNRFMDARRKRRNFSRKATEILNEYFHSHLSNPYPSDAEKDELARQCQITVSQVANWFGNKRIRYKKNIGKAQSDAQSYLERRVSQENQYGVFGGNANGIAGPAANPMINPYAIMLPPNQPYPYLGGLDFSAPYNPQMLYADQPPSQLPVPKTE